jgi:hypothetical protein
MSARRWSVSHRRRRRGSHVVLELPRRLRFKAKDASGPIFLGPEGRRMDPDYFDVFIFGRIAAKA